MKLTRFANLSAIFIENHFRSLLQMSTCSVTAPFKPFQAATNNVTKVVSQKGNCAHDFDAFAVVPAVAFVAWIIVE